MGWLAAIIIWLLALALAAPFVLGPWQPPEAITEVARRIDDQMWLTFAITGIIFLTAQFALGYALWKFGRQRPEPASPSHGNDRWEVLWTSGAAVLFLGLTLMGYSAWAEVRFDKARSGDGEPDVTVEVVGQQFIWSFRYPGADNRFGPTSPDLMDESLGNPLGVDRDSRDGADDLVTARLAVPVNQETELVLLSKDVLHNFFVPELRVKLDTVPGLVNRLRIRPEKVGAYEIACSELCGLGHYRMRAYLQVMSEDDYRAWLAEQASYLE